MKFDSLISEPIKFRLTLTYHGQALCDWRFEKKISLRIKPISKVQLSFIVLTNHSQVTKLVSIGWWQCF